MRNSERESGRLDSKIDHNSHLTFSITAEEVGERFTFLTTQKQDLEDSLRKLRSAIERIDRASKERFRETFHLGCEPRHDEHSRAEKQRPVEVQPLSRDPRR